MIRRNIIETIAAEIRRLINSVMTLSRNIVEIFVAVLLGITRHHPVRAGSRSWVSRHLSLHLSIRGDEVRVRSCLIFRYRIWPKKQCILENHSNLLWKYNSCRLLLPITHKYLSSHETRKHRHIFVRVAAFWQRVFQTLPNLDVHPGVAVYHTLKIFSIVNAKDLLMPHTKFQVCTLKINTIFCHRKKKSHYFWTGVYIITGVAIQHIEAATHVPINYSHHRSR